MYGTVLRPMHVLTVLLIISEHDEDGEAAVGASSAVYIVCACVCFVRAIHGERQLFQSTPLRAQQIKK